MPFCQKVFTSENGFLLNKPLNSTTSYFSSLSRWITGSALQGFSIKYLYTDLACRSVRLEPYIHARYFSTCSFKRGTEVLLHCKKLIQYIFFYSVTRISIQINHCVIHWNQFYLSSVWLIIRLMTYKPNYKEQHLTGARNE